MVLYARADQLEVKCDAAPGSSHVRPRRDARDPHSDFVRVWGVDCPPCERGHLRQDPHWAKSRNRIPLTPDEEAEAQAAIADAARLDAQLKLMEARERASQYRQAAADGRLDGLEDPDDVAITTGSTPASPPVVTETLRADPGASYRAMTLPELRKLARDLGLPVTGNKSDLVARHVEYATQ